MSSPRRGTRTRRVDILEAFYRHGLDESHVGTHGTLALWFDSYTGKTEVTYVSHFTHYPPFTVAQLSAAVAPVDDRVRENRQWNNTLSLMTFGVHTPDDLDHAEMKAVETNLRKLAKSFHVSTVRGDLDDVLLILNRPRAAQRRDPLPRSPTRRRLSY